MKSHKNICVKEKGQNPLCSKIQLLFEKMNWNVEIIPCCIPTRYYQFFDKHRQILSESINLLNLDNLNIKILIKI